MCYFGEDIKPCEVTVERQDSMVRCELARDAAECAIKLAEGRADFGIFAADELLLANHFYSTGLQVVGELKNRYKLSAGK